MMTVKQRGQGTVEYALIIGLVAVVVVAALLLLGPSVGNVFSGVKNGMEKTPPATQTVSTTGQPTTTPTVAATPATTPTPGDRPTPTPSGGGDRGGGTSFYDSFDGTSDSKWQEVGSKWKQADGYYYPGDPNKENRTFSGDTSWKDYTVEVKANLLKGNGYGIYFRATNPQAVDAYVFQYDPGYGAFLFRKVKGGQENPPFAVSRAPADYSWWNQDRIVRVSVKGDTFVASVDGTPVVTGRDSELTNGEIGLRTWSGSSATFDYVQVTP